MTADDRISTSILKSNYISRDLSWLKFNYRVLDQAKEQSRTIFERLKFLAIASSNLDEFFMIRVGSLYNYIDYGKERVDNSGLRELPFKKKLLSEIQLFFKVQNDYYQRILKQSFEKNNFQIKGVDQLMKAEQEKINTYFKRIIFPMLTPMLFDVYHTFPTLMNQILIFGVITIDGEHDKKHRKKLSFVQVPKNLPRFFEIERADTLIFVPIEEIIRKHIHKLFRNVEILSVNLLRITRNGDYTLEENEDIEINFLEEMRRKIKKRRTGRVVRIEAERGYDRWMLEKLKSRWKLDSYNIFKVDKESLMDFTGLWQIINHSEFKNRKHGSSLSIPPLSYPEEETEDIFEILKQRDILLHHPYNSIDPLLDLLEKAAIDAHVLSIKLTIYRLAKDSRVTTALLKAAENGKHVSVLFEVKARFDEENNMKEAKKLQKAGCFVIYGMSNLKTHTKLLLIVRKESRKVTRYIHMSSGNYNEVTSKLYTDIGLMTTNEVYANDVSEFFNVITGHSLPYQYEYLITAPKDMRKQLIKLIMQEAENAKKGLPAGIVIKINSLQDKKTIDALYKASMAGVSIKLIVRGICCLRPQRKDLSENIMVYSIVGEFLEHSRIFYFHNNGEPRIYGGSADVMVRSFDRRIESLFLIADEPLKKEVMTILAYSLRDNVNTYILQENGNYVLKELDNEPVFNIHKVFFKLSKSDVKDTTFFSKIFLDKSEANI